MEKKTKKSDKFGMPDLSFEPIKRRASDSKSAQPLSSSGDQKTRGGKAFMYAAVVLILVLFASATYLLIKSGYFDKPQKEAPIAQPVVPEEPDEDTLVEIKDEVSADLPAGVRYYVIVGGFKVKENAEMLHQKLKEKGMNTRIIEPDNRSTMFRVSADDYATLEEALARREAIKGEFDLSIWVLKK